MLKLSRRDFIHAGCAAAVVTLAPSAFDVAEARIIRGTYTSQFLNPLLSQRNVINVWYPGSEWNYAYIDHVVLGDNSMSPVGTAFGTAWSSTATFQQVIDQNGWVNSASGSGQLYGGGLKFPASSNFSGPYVITWDGDGQAQFNAGTWTEASTSIVRSGNANGTTTLSGFSDVTGISIGFGVSGTGVTGGTTVVSINYSTKSIVVSATVTTGSAVSFTFTNNSYTKNANGRWTNTTGGKGYVVANLTGHTGYPNLISIQIAATGSTAINVSSMSWSGGLVTVTTASPHGRPIGYTLPLTFSGATPTSINSTFDCTVTGASTYTFALASNPGSITGTITYIAFLTNLRIYRLEDETDFMPTSKGGNGYVFRRPYKQVMVNMRPAAIRLLNWVNGNDSILYRYENRSLPTKVGANSNPTCGPSYNATGGTNQITVAAVSSPFPGNKNLTPASMVHGEVVQTRVTNSTTGAGISITAITKASPGVVTTSGAHGFSNGTQVWLEMQYTSNAPAGMKELDHVAAIVTGAASTTFQLTDLSGVNIDTTSFSTFSGGSVYPYISLVVGSGNDRVAYPVVSGGSGNGSPRENASVIGGISGNTYRTFYFDKNQAGRRTAGTSPNWVQGAWLLRDDVAQGDVPIEQCAALVAEINILSQSQGISTPIHLWITTPPTCLLDCDPDYSTQSEYPINAINALFNGGYGCIGLGATNASLIWEWSNELWNFGTFAANYTNWLCYVRGAQNIANFESIQALRSTRMMRAVRAGSAWSSRVYTTLGMQGIHGWDVQNQYVALGNLADPSNIIFTDPWNNWGSATPVSFHDAVNPATYLNPMDSYASTSTGTGTLTDDSALYNGTNNSGNGGGNYTGAANPTQAIANFVANIVNSTTDQTIGAFCSQASPSSGILAQYNTAMAAMSKRVIQYEGGADWACAVGSNYFGHTITSGDSLFLNAVSQSSQWASAQAQFFQNIKTLSNHGPPALYLYLKNTTSDLRWGYVAPDSYSGGVEGAALTSSAMWTAMSARNAGLSV